MTGRKNRKRKVKSGIVLPDMKSQLKVTSTNIKQKENGIIKRKRERPKQTKICLYQTLDSVSDKSATQSLI